MSKLAFLFPGQASQYPGMGRDLAENFPESRAVFDEADAALGFSISKLCFEGAEEALKLTENYAARDPDRFRGGVSRARKPRNSTGFCRGTQPGRIFRAGGRGRSGVRRRGEAGAAARPIHAGGGAGG